MAVTAGDDRVIRLGERPVRIRRRASDTGLPLQQLLADGRLDYLIFDCIAEGSMMLFCRMQAAAQNIILNVKSRPQRQE